MVEMSLGLPSKNWTWWGKITAAFLMFAVTVAGLVFTFGPMFDLGWLGKPPSDKVSFYVTGVGVPLLTFAGFLAVLLGFLVQQEQNELQEQQIEAQQANFQKNRFESTFFQLLRTHNQIVEDIQCEIDEMTWLQVAGIEAKNPELPKEERKIQISGRSCFEVFCIEFEKEIWMTLSEEDWRKDPDYGIQRVKSLYKKWFRKRKSQLNHYFNNLTKIISFVDESEVEDKQFYIDLVIAQMSVPELVLFFYHSAAMMEQKRYAGAVYELLGEYTFFEQIDPERSLIHEQHSRLHEEALERQ